MILYLITLLILIVCLYVHFHKTEPFQSSITTLSDFNKLYDASLIPLPMNLFALGINENTYKTHGNVTKHGNVLIDYWMNEIHPFVDSKKYYILICPFDGYMEYTKFKEGEMTDIIPSDYKSSQFIEEVIDSDKYPIFHEKKTIFAMCKKTNDKHTVLLPDLYYITRKGYTETLAEIDSYRIPFSKKQSLCIWRGNLDNGSNHNFFNTDGKHELNQRNYFKKLHEENRFPKVNYKNIKTSMEQQMKYKYILDIDGFSNTWDATIWKLYSGSVLLKPKSKWKQWYYDKLNEWEHYVPIENDFSDLNDKIEWCIHNEDKCIQITEKAREFVVNTLNWDKVNQDIRESVKGKI